MNLPLEVEVARAVNAPGTCSASGASRTRASSSPPTVRPGPTMPWPTIRSRRCVDPERREPHGWRLAVNGARRDTWPNGMLRDQLAGAAVHVLPPDPRQVPEAVDTFGPAADELLATVAARRTGTRRGGDCPGEVGWRRGANRLVHGVVERIV